MAYNNRGIVRLRNKEYDQAIADLTKAIDVDPKHGLAHANRGLAYSAKKEYERAIADLSKAIEINPNFAGAYSSRGFAHLAKKEYELAIADYNKAIEMDSKNALAFANRGVANSNLGRRNEAISDMRTAASIDPANQSIKDELKRLEQLQSSAPRVTYTYTPHPAVRPASVYAPSLRPNSGLRFGAIAYSRSAGAYGWSNDYPSQDAAQSLALENCRKHASDCSIVLWYSNACGALAVGSNAYGSAWGVDQPTAEREALQRCSQLTSNCSVKRWACTTRYR